MQFRGNADSGSFVTLPQEMNQHAPGRLVYSRAPLLVYWELTRACDLICHHCRAEAMAERHPDELTTPEAKRLLEAIRGFGERSPHLVLTGGDPLKRPDFLNLLEHGAKLGLHMSVAPSGTNALTREVLHCFKSAGVESIALSLDGSTADRHDGFRGVPGCFHWTLEAAQLAREEGLALQISTLVTADTGLDIPEIYQLVRGLGPMRWSLFYLIAVGRGRGLKEVTADQCEALHHQLCDFSKETPFAVATTEAPHYRRVYLQNMKEAGIPLSKIRATPVGRGFGVRDGNGIMFVSHTGDVYPSGFLPLTAGNVRNTSVVSIYRDSETFRTIRETGRLKGRCGRCEFKEICGGSRARAYAATGDFLETDPLCAYEPETFKVGKFVEDA
ncbi:MAG: TIGR04053 family radical SAM/SPASM domain-containing protein [Deltaproteobacteria bacterium]|nr:TIGR04053 family radical SAM/SPASM domain-containing protein [Deltaproteobacteria bacterium]